MTPSPARHPPRSILLVAFLTACGLAEPTPQRESVAEAAPVQAAADRDPPLEIGHTLGAEDAPVTVMEFSDFGCSACAEFARETMPALRREFVDAGEVKWRYVPIRQGFYRGAEAARAAECAAEQGQFWKMHDLLLERQHEWQGRGDLLPVLTRYAQEIVPEPELFAACYRSERTEATLRLHDMVALSIGVRGVPVFLVGGQRVIGALETDRFARILREKVEAQRAATGIH